MLAVDKDTILKDGYAKAVRISIEPYLTDREIVSMYKDKIIAYGRDCGYTFTEEEAVTYIQEQLDNMDHLQEKNDAPVHLRFQ